MARLAGTDARDPRSRQIIVVSLYAFEEGLPAEIELARDNEGGIDEREREEEEEGKIEYQDTTIRQPSLGRGSPGGPGGPGGRW